MREYIDGDGAGEVVEEAIWSVAGWRLVVGKFKGRTRSLVNPLSGLN